MLLLLLLDPNCGHCWQCAKLDIPFDKQIIGMEAYGMIFSLVLLLATGRPLKQAFAYHLHKEKTRLYILVLSLLLHNLNNVIAASLDQHAQIHQIIIVVYYLIHTDTNTCMHAFRQDFMLHHVDNENGALL